MLTQKQPNDWSCLVTAFAMVCDMKVEDLIAKIGHDGSEALFPPPKVQRGFHIQEIICALVDDFSVTEIIDALFDNGKVIQVSGQSLPERVIQYMRNHSGVLWVTKDMGYDHALAWDQSSGLLCDPKTGLDGNKNNTSFQICGFWIVERKSNAPTFHQVQVTSENNGE